MSNEMPTVLVVDDDLHVLASMRRALSTGSWTVLTACDGQEALSMLERHNVAVVICDYAMPAMTGIDVLNAVRERCPDVVRILVTGEGDLDVATRAINESEVFRLLHKPCTPALIPAVEAALASRNSGLGEAAREDLAKLSTRERDVVDLIASGLRVAQVAKRLFISEHTVRNHLKACYRKLGMHSQGQLVARFGAAANQLSSRGR